MLLHSSIRHSIEYCDNYDGMDFVLNDNCFDRQKVKTIYLNSCHQNIRGYFRVHFNDIIDRNKVLGIVGEVDYIKGGIICIGNRICIYSYCHFHMLDIKGIL